MFIRIHFEMPFRISSEILLKFSSVFFVFKANIFSKASKIRHNFFGNLLENTFGHYFGNFPNYVFDIFTFLIAERICNGITE